MFGADTQSTARIVRFKGIDLVDAPSGAENAAPAIDGKGTRLSRDVLLGIAVARGCDHYASFASATLIKDLTTLDNETLGCALFVGPEDVDTFQAIRVGAMVLSDCRCDPERVVEQALRFEVGSRVRHVAQLGAIHDRARSPYWESLIRALPPPTAAETAFLPGVSRLCIEPGLIAPGVAGARVWLRT